MRSQIRSGSCRQSARRGLTLLEVILSIGIFLAASTVLTQLLGTGTRAAVEGRRQSQLALLAESKMAEVVSGILEPDAVDGQGFDDPNIDASIRWGMIVEETGQGDLLQITIEVTHENAQREESSRFALTRLMRDPQAWLDAAMSEEE